MNTKLIKAMTVVLASMNLAHADVGAPTAGSLWNGAAFHDGLTNLIQSADNPNDFFWLPERFSLVSKSVAVKKLDGTFDFRKEQAVAHTIRKEADGSLTSVYNFKVRMDTLDLMTQLRAEPVLRAKFGDEARVVGMLKVCGIQAQLPTLVHGGNITPSTGGTRVILGFSQSEPGKCNLLKTPSEFAIQVEVPMNHEPAVAKAFMAGSAIPLPTVRLEHPTRYTDEAELLVDAAEFVKTFKGGGSISGEYKGVGATLSKRVSEMIQRYSLSGLMKFNIQSRDPAMRARFEKILTDALIQTFFKFIPANDSPATPPTPGVPDSVGTKGDGGGIPLPYKVHASLDLEESTAEKIKTIRLKIQDVVYGTVASDAEIHIPAISADKIAPEVRKLME